MHRGKSVLVDVLLGLVLTGAASLGYVQRWPLLERLEMKAYDMRSTLFQSLDAGGREIMLVTIDDDSIARLGPWPWPRTRLAQGLDILAASRPKVIGLDLALFEPEQSPGLQEVRDLARKYGEAVKSRKIIGRGSAPFGTDLAAVAGRLDSDSKLGASIANAGNVVLPMWLGPGGAAASAEPAWISSSAVTVRAAAKVQPQDFLSSVAASFETPLVEPVTEGLKTRAPLEAFGRESWGAGNAGVYPDFDGVVRRDYPAIKDGTRWYPSYALALAMRYLGLRPQDVTVVPGSSVGLGKISIPTDGAGSMPIAFPGPSRSFRYYSFDEVLNGKAPPDAFKDKIVIVGPSSERISPLFVTPLARGVPQVEIAAGAVETMLHGPFVVRPPWAVQAELGALAAAALIVMFLLPRLRTLKGLAVTLAALAALAGAASYFFTHGQWLRASYPALLLAAGYFIVSVRRLLSLERRQAVPATRPASAAAEAGASPAMPVPLRSSRSPEDIAASIVASVSEFMAEKPAPPSAPEGGKPAENPPAADKPDKLP